MSWLLKNKRKVAAALILTLVFTPVWYMALLLGTLIAFHRINTKLSRTEQKNLSILHNRQQITKINTLIIGDTCPPAITEKFRTGNAFALQFPDRSLEASYQIFMHVESILEEKGRLIIIHDTKIAHNKLSIFDFPYLHSITIKELKCENWKNKQKYPLLYEPVKCFRYLINLRKRNYQEAACPKNELNTFCSERGIDFVYLRTK